MIRWIANKEVDLLNINNKITELFKTNNFTNNRINVINAQNIIKNIFKIDESKEVLMVCNGAMGLNALVSGYNIFYNKKLRWCVQSFTFPCSIQGNLIDSLIIDINENMGPNINKLLNHVNEYDGIIITNCFGSVVNIELYENFCKIHNKILLFDNAATSMTFYKDKNSLNYGNGSMVSLHHTKPIGFGEGGFIVFDKNMLSYMEKTLCFGFTATNRYNYNIYSNNYKMSEIACIYILEYLKKLNTIRAHHIKIFLYFIEMIEKNNLNDTIEIFKNYANPNDSFMATIPILFKNNININIFINNNIEAKKYYYPLNNDIISNTIFKKIICLPLNMDINENT